jgi:hypothetical protein
MARKYFEDPITLNKLIIGCLDIGTKGPTEKIQDCFVPVWITTLTALLKESEQNSTLFSAMLLEGIKKKIVEIIFRKEGALFLEVLKESKQFECIAGVMLRP